MCADRESSPSQECVCVCVDTESTWVHASSLILCVGGGGGAESETFQHGPQTLPPDTYAQCSRLWEGSMLLSTHLLAGVRPACDVGTQK